MGADRKRPSTKRSHLPSAKGRARRLETARAARANPTVPLLIGFAGIVVAGIAVLIFMNMASKDESPATTTAAAPARQESVEPRVEAAPPALPPAPTRPPASAPLAEETVEEPRRDVFDLGKAKKKTLKLLPGELPHPEGVDEQTAVKIEAHIDTVCNLAAAGAELSEARSGLQTLGARTLPALLTRFYRLDMADPQDVIRANGIVQMMTAIGGLQGRDYFDFPYRGVEPEDVEFRQTVRERWFKWWGDEGQDLLDTDDQDLLDTDE
jgi:hypothetical protein